MHRCRCLSHLFFICSNDRLPIGGFRSIKTSISQLAPVSRTDRLSSPRTSTASSNLSDTRILHEVRTFPLLLIGRIGFISLQLRANPLFTRAKEHLDVDADSSGCRSERSSIDSRANSDKNEKTTPYVQLNDFSTSHHRTSPPKKSTMETIILHPSELNRMLGKRTKSSNDVNQAKAFRSLPATPCRQSELELIFQVDSLVTRFLVYLSHICLTIVRNGHNDRHKIFRDVT